METPIIQIKNSITRILKGLDPDVDVFFEEIKHTDGEHGMDTPGTYYFVSITPSGNKTVDKFYTDNSVLVDIAYHEGHENNTAYLLKGSEMDCVFRPVFVFGERRITVPDADIKVADHVLHYVFNISFRHSKEYVPGEPVMDSLEIKVKRSG